LEQGMKKSKVKCVVGFHDTTSDVCFGLCIA
jgi:hypothetical protein